VPPLHWPSTSFTKSFWCCNTWKENSLRLFPPNARIWFCHGCQKSFGVFYIFSIVTQLPYTLKTGFRNLCVSMLVIRYPSPSDIGSSNILWENRFARIKYFGSVVIVTHPQNLVHAALFCLSSMDCIWASALSPMWCWWPVTKGVRKNVFASLPGCNHASPRKSYAHCTMAHAITKNSEVTFCGMCSIFFFATTALHPYPLPHSALFTTLASWHAFSSEIMVHS